jgi:hypothetical protein
MFSLSLLMVGLSWLTKNQASFNAVMNNVFETLRMIQLPLVRVLLTLVVCGAEGRIRGMPVQGNNMQIQLNLYRIGFTNLKV